MFRVPDRPGIGLDIDERKLAQFPYKPKPIVGFYGADGAVVH